MNREKKRVRSFSLTNTLIIIITDLLALAAVVWLAVVVRISLLPVIFSYYAAVQIPPGITGNLWWLPLVVITFLFYEGLYSSRMPYWREFEKIITAITLSYLIILALVYLAGIYGEVSRTAIVFSYFFSLFALPTTRYLARSFFNRFSFWRKRILIVGTGPAGLAAARGITNEPYLGYEIIGFVDEYRTSGTIEINGTLKIPIIGSTGNFLELSKLDNADMVIVAAYQGETGESMVQLANRLHERVKSLILIPDLAGLPVIGVETDYFFNEQLISLRIRNNLSRPGKLFLKRSFDLAAGVLLLLLFLPLMALIAAAIKIDSPGPVIFAQERAGRRGKKFFCLKFRTMSRDAEKELEKLLASDPALEDEWKRNFKLKKDPRVTLTGRALRAASLDELPQLVNVIKGEMSLVGPRPRPLYELEQQSDKALFQAGLEVRPGLTGLWQVSGRSELDFQNRIRLDSWYVRNWSFWLDISILLRTAWVWYKKSGAR